MALTDTETLETLASSEESLKIPVEKTETKDLTTSEVKETAEHLPSYVFDEFGEEVTKRILRGNGNLEVCIGDMLITVVPETKTILLPINCGPLVERWLRAPWRDAVHDFENSFLTLEIKPDKDKALRYGLGDIDEEDTDSFSIDKLPKDPNEKHHFFKQVAKTRVTLTDVRMMEEGPKVNSISPEDEIVLKESQENPFTSEMISPNKNLMLEVMPENSSLVKEFIEPIIPIINEAIERFNRGCESKVYGTVYPEEVTTSLLYKVPRGRPDSYRDSYRKELKTNLTPLVLSPSVCVFRGYRGFMEDTLVVAQTETGWGARFFPQNSEKSLSERIDSWLQEKSS